MTGRGGRLRLFRRLRHLILQRHFQATGGEAAFVVAAAGLSLAFPPPAGPVPPVLALLWGQQQHCQQTPHFRHGEGD
jgi:hypothetical protein